MIKKYLRLLIVTSVIILLPIAVGLVLWGQLPDQFPVHWNMEGEVDGWAPKALAVFGLPMLLLAIQWLCTLATLADPKKQNHTQKALTLVLWIIPVIGTVLALVIYFGAMGEDVRVERILPILLGLLFVAIGNYLPKCRQNYTIGIKIPWTLHSEENWNKTHRLAGFVWVVCGILMMATGFFGITWVLLVLALPMILIPFVYSYLLYRKGI